MYQFSASEHLLPTVFTMSDELVLEFVGTVSSGPLIDDAGNSWGSGRACIQSGHDWRCEPSKPRIFRRVSGSLAIVSKFYQMVYWPGQNKQSTEMQDINHLEFERSESISRSQHLMLFSVQTHLTTMTELATVSKFATLLKLATLTMFCTRFTLIHFAYFTLLTSLSLPMFCMICLWTDLPRSRLAYSDKISEI